MQDMAGRGAASVLLSGDAPTASTSSSQFPSSQSYWDSDFETEPDPPDWRHSINQEELNQLNPREKKRQDVINGKKTPLGLSASSIAFSFRVFPHGEESCAQPQSLGSIVL